MPCWDHAPFQALASLQVLFSYLRRPAGRASSLFGPFPLSGPGGLPLFGPLPLSGPGGLFLCSDRFHCPVQAGFGRYAPSGLSFPLRFARGPLPLTSRGRLRRPKPGPGPAADDPSSRLLPVSPVSPVSIVSTVSPVSIVSTVSPVSLLLSFPYFLPMQGSVKWSSLSINK